MRGEFKKNEEMNLKIKGKMDFWRESELRKVMRKSEETPVLHRHVTLKKSKLLLKGQQ